MRSLSITTLMLLAAFALGLTLGGQLPREVAAQDEEEGITWENDGQNLLLVNQSGEKLFLVRGQFEAGANVQAPAWDAKGSLKVSVSDLDEIRVYELEEKLACNPWECRSCDEGSFCPSPQWPPFSGTEVRTLVSQ